MIDGKSAQLSHTNLRAFAPLREENSENLAHADPTKTVIKNNHVTVPAEVSRKGAKAQRNFGERSYETSVVTSDVIAPN